MAGQKRGLILGLASLAGSTGRIRESKERQSVLSAKLRLDDLEARLRQRELDDADRKEKLSELLNDDRARAIMAMPGLTEEQKYALSLGLRANMPFVELSKMIQPRTQQSQASTMLERLFSPDELRDILRAREFRASQPRSVKPEISPAEKIRAAERGVAEARQRLTEEETQKLMENAPAEDPMVGAGLTPGLSALLKDAGPVGTSDIARKVSERLKTGLAASGAPASRIGMVEPAQPQAATFNPEAELAADYIDLKAIPRASLDQNQLITPTDKGRILINLLKTHQADPKNPAARKAYFDERLEFQNDPDSYFTLSD